MARLILVHGAWHGGWCWEEIVPRLVALGHEVLAPDLPGMGSDASPGHVATLNEWSAFIAGMASAFDEPVVLVGHSQGGAVISRAAEMAPKAVRRLVYLAAVMALPGESTGEVFEGAPQERMANLAAAMVLSDDGRTAAWGDREAALASFYSATPQAKADAAFPRLTPEPTSIRTTPIELTAERYGSLPRTYIRCENDNAIFPKVQDYMIARQACDVHSLPTDHSPFFSVPDELASLLDRIVTE